MPVRCHLGVASLRNSLSIVPLGQITENYVCICETTAYLRHIFVTKLEWKSGEVFSIPQTRCGTFGEKCQVEVAAHPRRLISQLKVSHRAQTIPVSLSERGYQSASLLLSSTNEIRRRVQVPRGRGLWRLGVGMLGFRRRQASQRLWVNHPLTQFDATASRSERAMLMTDVDSADDGCCGCFRLGSSYTPLAPETEHNSTHALTVLQRSELLTLAFSDTLLTVISTDSEGTSSSKFWSFLVFHADRRGW